MSDQTLLALNNGVDMPALGPGVSARKLADDQLAAIDGLDTGQRGGPEPDDITLESYGRAIPED